MKLVVTALISVLFIGLVPTGALADKKPPRSCGTYQTAEACPNPDVPGVTVTDHTPTPSSHPTNSDSTPAGNTQGSGVACGPDTRGRLQAAGDGKAVQDAALCAGGDPCAANAQATGVPQRQTIVVKPGQDVGGVQCDRSERKAIVTAAVVWEQVRRLLPKAAIGLAPRTTTLVNLQTIMWVDAQPQQDLPTVTIFGEPVSIHIGLTKVSWDFGDGDTDAPASPGKPYDNVHDPCAKKTCSDYYGHAYVRTGSMTITATASYHATFQVAGGPVVDIPGDIDGPTAAANIVVHEARAVLVPDPTPN